jgi:asparaginyl-tRNA synthetase
MVNQINTSLLSIKFIHNNFNDLFDSKVKIGGWIRTCRSADGGNFLFVDLVDGSSIDGIQLIITKNIIEDTKYKNINLTGTSLLIEGILSKTPENTKQKFEVKVNNIIYYGECAKGYPLSKNRMSMEYLRENIHLRPRTNIIGVVTRIRNALSIATHNFFQEKEFIYIHTPIISHRDAEGGSDMFKVITDVPSDNIKENNKKYFNKDVYLTASGQLDVENFACALSKVYTFGPCFRSEKSSTSRHLSEFWMIEPEIAFYELNDIMNLSEEYVKYCCNYVLKNNYTDLEFLNQRVDKECLNRINNICDTSFERITYTKAIQILIDSNFTFENKVEWGLDLNSEHERYICEKIYNKPVIIYDYPILLKSFYMRANNDGKTVAAMDMLVPGIGELIGGSQREENYDKLKDKVETLKLDLNTYKEYLDLRKYGTVPHSGFGLGFERLIMLVTGIENIKDVSLFPRVYGRIY